MASMEHFRDDALFAMEELSSGLREPLAPQEREELLHAFSEHCRIAAIGALLTEADVPELRRCLTLSAQARVTLLRTQPHQVLNRFRCSSQSAPFFDALVAGADTLALEIARHSPLHWAGDEELEEDFRYARFLYVFLLDGLQPTPSAEAALAAFQRADDAGGDFPTPRRTLCEALFAPHQATFQRALEDLLREHEQDAREREESGPLLHPARHHTGKHVFIEGLALLHLAETRGLRTQRDHPLLPGLARR